jgi:hypothetical protein
MKKPMISGNFAVFAFRKNIAFFVLKVFHDPNS